MTDVLPTAPAQATPPATSTPPDGAPPVAEAPNPLHARHKVKIDGADHEVSLEDLIKGHERSKASYKRFEEAATRAKDLDRREAEFTETIKLARSKEHRAAAIARLLGGDEAMVEFASDVLLQRAEWESLPPDERKRRETKSERERRLEADERALSEREAKIQQRREAEIDAESKRLQQEFTTKWPDLLRKAGAPPSRHAMQRMASAMKEAIGHGVSFSAEEAAAAVAAEMREEVRELARSSDPETLRTLLGDGAEKLRAAELARVQQQPGRTPPKDQPKAREAPARDKPRMTTEEYRKKFMR